MKRRIATGEFKPKCLALLNDVQQKREEIVVTKRGKPVARLVPIEEGKKPRLFGRMKGAGIILGDIISPSGEVWDAER